MAELFISGDELLVALSVFSRNFQGVRLESFRDGVLKLRLSLHRLLPEFSASLRFLSFEGGMLTFGVERKMARLLLGVLKRLGLGKGRFFSFSDGRITLDAGGLLEEKAPWLSLEDIVLEGNKLRVSFSIKGEGVGSEKT